MNCEEFRACLQAFTDNELPRAVRLRAESHLIDCEKCPTYLKGYRRTIELAKNSASDEDLSLLPEKLVRRILAARCRP
jgi:anti-sigma factor RsiW